MKKENLTPWLLLSPCLLIMGSTVFYPAVRTFLFSMQRYWLTESYDIRFIGLDNYRSILSSPEFWTALSNSVFVLFFVLLIAFPVSMLTGLLLNRKSPLNSVLTAAAIIPWALPPLVNGILWRFIFYPGYGLANRILLGLGLISAPFPWTENRFSALLLAALVVAWRVIPFGSILVLSSLQAIPTELYEAARVDGSSRFQEYWAISFPLLLPIFPILFLQISMAGINVFDELLALSGDRYELSTLLVYHYRTSFRFLDLGLGSAISYLILLSSGLLGYFYIRRIGKERSR